MSSGWCPRLHRFTASTCCVDDGGRGELAGSRVVARTLFGVHERGQMETIKWSQSHHSYKAICSMADGSSCGVGDGLEPVCSRKSDMDVFSSSSSKLDRSVGSATGAGGLFSISKMDSETKIHGNSEPAVQESMAGPRCPCLPISSRLSVPSGSTVRSESRAHLAVFVQAPVPSRFVEAVSSTRCSSQSRYRYIGQRGTPGRQGHCPDPVPDAPRHA